MPVLRPNFDQVAVIQVHCTSAIEHRFNTSFKSYFYSNCSFNLFVWYGHFGCFYYFLSFLLENFLFWCNWSVLQVWFEHVLTFD